MVRARQPAKRCVFHFLGAAIAVMTVTNVATAKIAKRAGDSTEEGTLQEIVVTALRRKTRLIDTPVAVSVVTAAEIQRQHITSLYGLAEQVPNLVFTQITRQETFVSIRGTQENNDTPGSDMGVSVFIDGVPRTGVHDTFPSMFDVQSIQVLRGPQGTLFGRNTTGGAIVIHTIPPSFRPHYKAQVTYGNHNRADVQMLVTGPLLRHVLAGKLALDVHREDGYIRNVTLNREDGAEKYLSARGQLLWRPTDASKITFGMDYFRDGSQSRVGSLVATFQPSLFPTLRFGPDFTNEATPPHAGNTILGGLIHADWSTPFGTLTSISGYRSVKSTINYAPVADPNNELLANQRTDDRQYTEEIHLASDSRGRLTWLLGLFYLHLYRSDANFFSANPVPGTAFSFEVPAGATQLQRQAVLTTSTAGFGSLTYQILKPLSLTLGGRYSYERRSGNTEITPLEASGPYAHSWSAFTPKGTITYQPRRNLLTYATIAKGFQSGGFDASAGSDQGLRTPFNPETVWSYEIGLKTQALHRSLGFDGDVFVANYDNLQRTAFDSNPAVNAYRTTNAGKARVKGIETETNWIPVRWLRLSLDYSYTDAKYLHYTVLQDNGTIANYSGNILPQTPRQQIHLAGEITVPWPAAHGDLIAGADYTYRSAIQYVDANNTPQSIINQSRYDGMINLHTEWRSYSDKWTIELFARNITNRRALVDFPDFTPYFATLAEYATPQDHVYLARYSPARSYGITVTFSE